MNLAVLLSGSGRTLDNFHDRIKDGTMAGSIEVVVGSAVAALGLTKAENYGYPAFYAEDNEAINNILQNYNIDLVLLAGFLKLYLPPPLLAKAVLNIHPSLIPSFCGASFYGMRVHQAVYDRGVTVSGCTVHFANEFYDEGPIVLQRCVQLADGDTPPEIAAKVFAAECEAYPAAINLITTKGVDYFWRKNLADK